MTRTRSSLFVALIVFAHASPGMAMGLRSFVALPIDKGGTVLRLQFERNSENEQQTVVANAAYGIGATQSLLLGLPYHDSHSGADQWGELSALYRHTVWQNDFANGTHRVGLLGGVSVPVEDSGADSGIQTGLVSTSYKGRHEWDIDALFLLGLDDRRNQGRYDVSWQYRLSPARYPDWGIVRQWNGVLELNGRWSEGDGWIHQLTLGLQWVLPRWVLEGGLFKDLNGPRDLHFLVGGRVHF